MKIYSKSGKVCFCDLAQLPQMLKSGYTKTKEDIVKDSGSHTSVKTISKPKIGSRKNPNSSK